MRGLKRATSVGLVIAAALAASITPASAATTTTRWVDNDGHAGPNGCGGSATAAKKIQKAVDHSNQADVIIVCPGTYVEQVTIQGNRDGLTLRSSTPFGATIKTPTSLDGFAILVLVNRVDGVTIEGFKTIVRTQAPCDHVEATIAGLGSRRLVVRGNRLLAPGTGTGSCYQLNGIGIQDVETLDNGRRSSASITSNEVRDALLSSIIAAGILTTTTFTIAGNSVRAYFGAPPSGISAQSARRALAGRVTLAAVPLGALIGGQWGIGLGGKVKGSVTGNVIQGSSDGPLGGPTFGAGIFAVGGNGPTPPNANGPIDIRGNLIRRVGVGISLWTADEITVRGNTINNVVEGVRLNTAPDNFVRRNSVSSKSSGIDVDAGSTGNAIRDNSFSGNGGTCQDSSAGGGSHGTANTWTGNTATIGDSPNGICPTP